MEVDLRWNHPSTTFIVGPSMSGKSTVVGNILKNVDSLHKTEKGKIKEKILIFRNYQDSYAAWERENLIDTKFAFFPSIEELEKIFLKNKENGGTLLILDDQEAGMTTDSLSKLRHLVTISAHHMNCSIIYVGHSLFAKNM